MILGMIRGILPAVTTYGAMAWPRMAVDATMRPLRGSRVSICGFGNIGRCCGRLLKGFGVKIWGISEHSGHTPPDYFTQSDALATVGQIDELLPETDHLLLVMPRTSKTDGFLDARRLALLPRHATVTNIGRGNAIVESALIEALVNGRLAGACLDVCETEPLPEDSPMRTCPRLWITPHTSVFGANYFDLFSKEFAARLANSRKQ